MQDRESLHITTCLADVYAKRWKEKEVLGHGPGNPCSCIHSQSRRGAVKLQAQGAADWAPLKGSETINDARVGYVRHSGVSSFGRLQTDTNDGSVTRSRRSDAECLCCSHDIHPDCLPRLFGLACCPSEMENKKVGGPGASRRPQQSQSVPSFHLAKIKTLAASAAFANREENNRVQPSRSDKIPLYSAFFKQTEEYHKVSLSSKLRRQKDVVRPPSLASPHLSFFQMMR